MTGALIGREEERLRLREALDEPQVRVVIVEGPSGAGKTALIDDALARAKGAITGCGKYAQGGGTGAFFPILEALSEAVNNALELLYDPVAGAASLREAMRPQLALLASAGLSAADVTPPALDPSLNVAGAAGAARLVDAAMRLMKWLEGFGAPVILFLDDWHRAPREAQSFVSALSRDSVACKAILAQRTDEVRDLRTVDEKSVLIEVSHLPWRERVALLDSETGKHGSGAPILQWLGIEFSGLPFDLIQVAEALSEQDALIDSGSGWLIDESRATAIDRADFSDIMRRRLRQIPEAVLRTGAALALWGDSAPLALVTEALGQVAGEGDAALLEQAGIITIHDGVARILHDRLRAALLNTIDHDSLKELAAAMSGRMAHWADERWAEVWRTALYLRLTAGLESAAPENWRDRFALGALAARTAADTAAATEFAEAAWTLATRARPQTLEADNMIFREAIFAAVNRRDETALRERAKAFIAAAQGPVRRGEAYETAIMGARLTGDFELAWKWCLEGFRHAGIRLPAKVGFHHLLWAALRWRIGMVLHRAAQPELRAGSDDPLVRLSSIAALVAFEREPRQATLIALKAATHARQHGYHDPIWLATDAFISGGLRQYEQSAAFGELALKHAGESNFARGQTLYRSAYFGLIWKRPLASLCQYCETIYEWSMAEGDLVNAAVAVRNDALLAWRTSPTLEIMVQHLVEDERRAELLADNRASTAIREFLEITRILRDPSGFVVPMAIGAEVNPKLTATGSPVVNLELLALRGEWPALLTFCQELRKIQAQLDAHTGGITSRFFKSLARIHMSLKPIAADVKFIRRVAALNPVDHRAKILLLEAEAFRRQGKRDRCLEAYALAVEFAAMGSSRMEEGIITEFAAFGSRIVGDSANATFYAERAATVWRKWGALAKLGPLTAHPDSTPQAVARIAEAESQVAVAERSERAKSRFLAEVAHELRTPLQGMQSLIELAANDSESVDVKELQDVVGSLRDVVDDLTELEALGAGAPLNFKTTELAGLLENEATTFAVLARKKGLRFTVAIDPSAAGLFLIDAPRLRQIVRNLLSNAIKYVESGSVELQARATAEGRDASRIRISVEDSGPGLSDADLPRLFEPFERQGRDTPDGLGLGLALSRRIAMRMNGQLTAENREPRGARFVLSFPAPRAEREAKIELAAVPLLRLLLVEDVALNRRMLAAMLRQDGHEVREATYGFEALELCRSERIDLVFLDLGLPDIDGIELLERLRALSAGVPVIVLTASAVPALHERAMAAGAKLVLRKPVSGLELRQALAFALRGTATATRSDEDGDLQSLKIEAAREIALQAQALVSVGGTMELPVLKVSAHRLAGLAAQFLAIEIAAAADRLEAAADSGDGVAGAIDGISEALEAYRRAV